MKIGSLRSSAFACLAMIAIASPVFGQNGAVRTDVDARKIGFDDTVTLSIVLDGDAANQDALLPALRNLRVVGGPSLSTQISFVNGSMSKQKSLSYVLKAEKTGAAEIGALSVSGYPATPVISIEVVQGSIRPAQQPQDPLGRDPFGGRDPFEEFFGRAQRRSAIAQGKLFVEAVLSRPSARVGEPILVTYYVYTQISLAGVEFADAPKYPGFWAEEIERSRNETTGENVSTQGEPYLRYPVLERILFPTKPGLLEIPEARLRLVPAGGNFGISAPIERSTKILKVKVDSLPQGVPEGSAVGVYQVEATADRTTIPLGDALTFRFKVKGRGNLKWVDAAPTLAIPGVKIFPPRVTSDLRTTRQGVDGSKTWEFVVVPERANTYEIPAIPFAYYNAESRALVTEHTDPIPIVVTEAAGSAPSDSNRGPSAGVSLRGDLDSPSRDLSSLALGLGLASLAAQVYVWRRRSSPVAGKTSNKVATDAALAELTHPSLLSGAKERVTARIAGALESVYGPRATWPSDDNGDRLRSLAEDLELLRFAPQLGSYDAKLKEVRDRAVALVEAHR